MRKRLKPAQQRVIERRAATRAGRDRDDCSQVAGAQSPEVQIGQAIAPGFDGLPNVARDAAIRRPIEQHGGCVA